MKKHPIFKFVKIPDKKSDLQIKNYFKEKGLYNILYDKTNPKNIYPPDLTDLYRLYEIISLNKRITVLEFGTGWSTLIFKKALYDNKIKYLKKINNLRRNNKFELFVIDNEKKYLEISKNRLNKYFGQTRSVKFIYSKNIISTWNDYLCHEFLKIPKVNPDFIYLDGPDQFNINNSNKINFNIDHLDLMPMSSDILKIEFFLVPGTIVVSDGRSANVEFLIKNFKRDWIHYYDRDFDQHILYLNSKSLGKLNDMQLNFYK